MKISDLLEQYPDAMDVLLKASPAFEKLKNPVLRKILARRVTIAQAAGIGGISQDSLLVAINESCGTGTTNHKHGEMDGAEMENERTETMMKPDVLSKILPEKYVTVDVREDIRNNSDPFKKIMAAVKQLRDGEVLHLINSFEPVPLYDVLSRRGLQHWSARSDGDWHVYFYHDASVNDVTVPNENVATRPTAAEEKVIELDVSGLEPPEPMMKILVTLPMLDEHTSLLIHHHREPKMLYPQLQDRGYEWITTKLAEDRYRIVIRLKKSA